MKPNHPVTVQDILRSFPCNKYTRIQILELANEWGSQAITLPQAIEHICPKLKDTESRLWLILRHPWYEDEDLITLARSYYEQLLTYAHVHNLTLDRLYTIMAETICLQGDIRREHLARIKDVDRHVKWFKSRPAQEVRAHMAARACRWALFYSTNYDREQANVLCDMQYNITITCNNNNNVQLTHMKEE